jgi:hypothetical protein
MPRRLDRAALLGNAFANLAPLDDCVAPCCSQDSRIADLEREVEMLKQRRRPQIKSAR